MTPHNDPMKYVIGTDQRQKIESKAIGSGRLSPRPPVYIAAGERHAVLPGEQLALCGYRPLFVLDWYPGPHSVRDQFCEQCKQLVEPDP
jgi:hypothetical protein